ncbi:GalNAc(5)-diNAcBac-PP-undecaprenol beta-1,3-glucosyltransferase [compost metagenome]
MMDSEKNTLTKKIKEFIESGHFSAAMEFLGSLDESMQLDPEFINAKAILLLAMGQTNEAEDVLIDGISKHQECGELYYNLGSIYFDRDLYIESAICFAAFCRYADDLLDDTNAKKEIVENKMKQLSKLYVTFSSFKSASNRDFILVTEKPYGEDMSFLLLVFILSKWGNRIFYLTEPVVVHVDGFPEMKDVMNVVFNNVEEQDSVQLIRPVLLQSGCEKIDTTPYIIQRLSDEFSAHQHCDVICHSKVLDVIEDADSMDGTGNRFEVIFSPTHLKSVLSHGFFGDFYTTLNKLYNVNMSKGWQASSLLVSIVIPTRNNARTLEHTLKTCLQDPGNDYEIVISDNSSSDNDDTLLLVNRINDPRIKYFRPERELQLKENFEYAYCQAQGEFIFSLGSDDAVLRSGLDTLRKTLREFPNEEVIVWDRLLYYWPGVDNGREHEFYIPSPSYEANNIKYGYMDTNIYLQAILELKISMFRLPMFYINSGFRRSYLQKLIEKTGKFLDGHSQDIYTGLINFALNDQLLYVQHPITIAGLSSNSTGLQMIKVVQSSATENEYENKIKQFAANRLYNTKVLPQFGFSDQWLLFCQFAKICNKKISPKFKLQRLNWKFVYASCVEALSGADPSFQQRLLDYEAAATALGDEEFTRWFKENYSQNRNFKGTIYPDKFEKQYYRGIQKSGALIIEASLFEVKNVYDACQLYNKLFSI